MQAARAAAADDLAAACLRIGLLRLLAPIFRIAEKAAGLAPNAKKCVLIPLIEECTPEIEALYRDRIATEVPEFASFQGSTADLLRTCMSTWWARLGSTKASGISKLMMSEARNFPELAAFYQQEVIQPGNELIRRVLQRGVDRGEFRPMDMKYGVYLVLAPMLFLSMWKHSLGTCCAGDELNPEDYIALQVETLLNGLSIAPAKPLNTTH